MVVQRSKYDLKDTFVKHSFLINEEDRKFYNYFHDDYKRRFEALETITPYLRELGKEREDMVISIPDGSPNISLYMMNQKGVSGYGAAHVKDAERIWYYVERGMDYLIINDPWILNKEYLKPSWNIRSVNMEMYLSTGFQRMGNRINL